MIIEEIATELRQYKNPFGISLGFKILEKLNLEMNLSMKPGDKLLSFPIFLNADSIGLSILRDSRDEPERIHYSYRDFYASRPKPNPFIGVCDV